MTPAERQAVAGAARALGWPARVVEGFLDAVRAQRGAVLRVHADALVLRTGRGARQIVARGTGPDDWTRARRAADGLAEYVPPVDPADLPTCDELRARGLLRTREAPAAPVPAPAAAAPAAGPRLPDRACECAFVDVETTGRMASLHQVIEVAVLRTDATATRELGAYASTVRLLPRAVVDAEALRTNGHEPYDPAWVAKARDMREVLPRVAELLDGDVVVVGHNLTFDLNFLRAAFASVGLAAPTFERTADTMALAHRLLVKTGKVARKSLDAVCEHFGVSNAGHHRAGADVARTAAVYRALRALEAAPPAPAGAADTTPRARAARATDPRPPSRQLGLFGNGVAK